MARRGVASVSIRDEWCKRCGICVEVCPKRVFEQRVGSSVAVVDLESCIACEICERICPDFAISIRYRQESPT